MLINYHPFLILQEFRLYIRYNKSHFLYKKTPVCSIIKLILQNQYI